MLARVKAWQDKNPEKVRVYRAKDPWTLHKRTKRLGMTVEQFWNMYENQKGKCVICLQDIAAENSAIDHNHKTGKIRGILCKSCNRGIGLLKDSSEVLNRGSNYLLENEEV
jgi:nitrate/TMAO reductase-like tetraheme cytochrome c subunit